MFFETVFFVPYLFAHVCVFYILGPVVTYQWLDKRLKLKCLNNNFLKLGRIADILCSYMYFLSPILKMKEFRRYDLSFLRYRGSNFTFFLPTFYMHFLQMSVIEKNNDYFMFPM